MAMTDMLYRLQELDLQEENLNKKKDQLETDPEYLEEKEKLQEALGRRERAKKELADTIKDQHRMELDLKLAVDRREDIRKRMYDGTVTNMKELEKMTRMIDDLDRTRSQLEDRILERMERVEILGNEIEKAEEECGQMQDRLDHMERIRQESAEQLEKELARIPDQREELAAAIPSDLVSRYQTARLRLGSRPLARIEKQVCTGCRVGISAAQMREIKKGDRLIQCESCGRILHWEKE